MTEGRIPPQATVDPKKQAIADQVYARAVATVREAGYGSRELLRTKCFIGWNMGSVFLGRMQAEGILGKPDDQGVFPLLPPP